MPKITITTKDGVVIEQIDLEEYDLSKPLARAHIIEEIAIADRKARIEEAA